MPEPTAAQLEQVGYTGFVPMEKWGRDHFSTLLYAETRAVDHGGVLDVRQMRTGTRDSTRYPTRLAEEELRPGHDDYDCLRDAEHAGLLIFANGTVEFTDAGWEYVGKMRRERAEKNFKGVKMADLAQLMGQDNIGGGVLAPKVG